MSGEVCCPLEVRVSKWKRWRPIRESLGRDGILWVISEGKRPFPALREARKRGSDFQYHVSCAVMSRTSEHPPVTCCCQRLEVSFSGSSRWTARPREGSLGVPLQHHYKGIGGKSRFHWHRGLLNIDASSRKKWQTPGTLIPCFSSHSSLSNHLYTKEKKEPFLWYLIPPISWKSLGLRENDWLEFDLLYPQTFMI